MHVTLIRPALVSSEASYSNPITPPLGLGYLAATLREAGISSTPIDAIGEAVDQFIVDDGYLLQGLTIEQSVKRVPAHTSLIGLSCMFTQDWLYARRMIKALRQAFPTVPIVAGGEHITAMPEFCLRECPEIDYCALGEGEDTIVELARAVEAGAPVDGIAGLAYVDGSEVRRTAPRARIRAVDDIPLPAWDLFPIEVYASSTNAMGVYRGRSMPILATRGCPYECTFCSNPEMYGRNWFARDPYEVLDEIELYINKYRADNIDFYDLTMILRKDWILEFCREIERRGLKFTWQLPSGTRSEVIDEEIAHWLYRTGCRNLTYAPESGSVDTLVRIKKKVKLPRLMTSVRAALKNKLNVKCNLIIGFPHETRRHIWDTVTFAWKMAIVGVHDVPLYMFSPYPGSELFEDLRRDKLAGELDENYFRSLTAYMDIGQATDYCRNLSAREVNFWRIFGMASFYGLSMLVRPWRFISLVRNVLRDSSDTVLEQRLGAMLRRPARPKALDELVALNQR